MYMYVMNAINTFAGIYGTALYLREQTLEQGMEHVVRVNATTPGSYVGNTTYTFLVNRPPYDGACAIVPEDGRLCVGYHHSTVMRS